MYITYIINFLEGLHCRVTMVGESKPLEYIVVVLPNDVTLNQVILEQLPFVDIIYTHGKINKQTNEFNL